jgi:hypothetical protein
MSRTGMIDLFEVVGPLLNDDALAALQILEASASLAFRAIMTVSMLRFVIGPSRARSVYPFARPQATVTEVIGRWHRN